MNDDKTYCKKVSFLDEANALKYIKKLKETSKRVKVPQRAYLCEVCLNWHLTSSTEAINPDSNQVTTLKTTIDRLERKLTASENRVKRLEKEKVKHHEQVYELNQKVEVYRKMSINK